jgi:hypothetical protein
MEDLFTYIMDCGEGCATPMNTAGMGNVALPGPDGEQVGTDGIPTAKAKKAKLRKKKKKIAESILDDDFDLDADYIAKSLIGDQLVELCDRWRGKTFEDIDQKFNFIQNIVQGVRKSQTTDLPNVINASNNPDYTMIMVVDGKTSSYCKLKNIAYYISVRHPSRESTRARFDRFGRTRAPGRVDQIDIMFLRDGGMMSKQKSGTIQVRRITNNPIEKINPRMAKNICFALENIYWDVLNKA